MTVFNKDIKNKTLADIHAQSLQTIMHIIFRDFLMIEQIYFITSEANRDY